MRLEPRTINRGKLQVFFRLQPRDLSKNRKNKFEVAVREKNIFTIFDLGSKLHDLVNKRGLTDIETMFEKCSKFGNSLSEPTELNVCQNCLPTVLRNRHVGRGLQ